MTFEEMARLRGLEPRMAYGVADVSRVTDVPRSTLYEEIKAGRLRCFLPAGRRQGMLVRPEWVDEWLDAGSGAA